MGDTSTKGPKSKDAASSETTALPKKAKRKVGRPQKSPQEEVLKNKAFNLPLSLIEKIVQYSDIHYNGNASDFATRRL